MRYKPRAVKNMDKVPAGMAALVEAEKLRDMFDRFALQAVERRLAYSFDRQRVDEVMFFLDVYNLVNGSDVLPAIQYPAAMMPRKAVNG